MVSSGVKVKVYDVLRYLGQETQVVQQSTTMPDKVLEVTLSQVATIL